jgi:hypothetical protein
MAGRRYRHGNARSAWLCALLLAAIVWVAFATAEYL